jgi:hypothetical protein
MNDERGGVMTLMSIQEISSLLFSRHRIKTHRDLSDQELPHRHWNETERAALVIFWGLLIYPKLDPDLREEHQSDAVHIKRFINIFENYLGSAGRCREVLEKLKEHDYIRFRDEEWVVPGTGLFSAVDAAKMYRYFRSSVLSRKIFQLLYPDQHA